MNKYYYLERIVYYILMVLIPYVAYYISKIVVNKTKYIGKEKLYLTLIGACLICILFFALYFLLVKVFDISIKVLNPLSFSIIPFSILFIIIFSILFFYHRYKNNKATH